MDLGTFYGGLLSGGVIAVIVSGGVSYVAERRRDGREDAAVRRQIRAAADAFAVHLLLAREFGFANFAELESTLANLAGLSSDRDIERTLDDRKSRALHQAVDLGRTFVQFSKSQGIDPANTLSNITPQERAQKQSLFAQSSVPTFEALRNYFREDGQQDIVQRFDGVEQRHHERRAIERGLA